MLLAKDPFAGEVSPAPAAEKASHQSVFFVK
jgi:hypothetical protein